jgi:hypothetical protein
MDVCPNCGAPLPMAEPGEIETCSFCEAETRARGQRPARVQQAQRQREWAPDLDSDPESAPQTSRPTVLFATLGGVAFVVAAVGIGLAIASSKHPSSSSAGGSSYKSSASAASSPPRILTPAMLATVQVDPWHNLPWIPLDTWIATGDLSAFDVVGNLDWASSIARAWSSDAKFWRLNVSGMAPDGTINLTTAGADVLFQYNSLTKGDLDFSIEVHYPRGLPANAPGANFGVTISSHRDSTARDELRKPMCPISKVFSILKASSGLANRNRQYGLSRGLSLRGPKEYWFVDYATGDMKVQGVEDFVNAVTCAIEHPK